ncbi:MAG: SpoIID/LytB domain-containing protein [Planctomycetota bacterium]
MQEAPSTAPSRGHTPPAHTFALAVLAVLGIMAALAVGSCSLVSTGRTGPSLYERIPGAGEPTVRVRVGAGLDTLHIGSAGVARPADGGTMITLARGGHLRLRDTGWVIEDGGGGSRRVGTSGPLVVRALTPGNPLRVDEATFVGELWAHARETEPGTFDLVEHLSVESYLPGVLARELYSHWHPQAYRAQAVAARSYALHEIARRRAHRSGLHYDLVSTTANQAYTGWTDRAVAHQAVLDTLGEVLTHDGELLRTYYSSTAGGRVAGAADSWPTTGRFAFNAAEPLQAGHRATFDDDAPRARWTVTRNLTTFARRIAAYGTREGFSIARLESIDRIDIAARNAAGRPTRYTVRDRAGRSFELAAEHMRIAGNYAASGIPRVEAKARLHSGDLAFRVTGSRLEIDGRGHGHGVGMSQFGAQGMAIRGSNYLDILAHFYPGSELTSWYTE